ncbi:hypothetical protein HERIO_1228 [Hepatospora eriocheir]|uniref:G domain-containing protein n=1 Tax=Hepatospora eriocheir TaxID=1081669 RepID=A0A1X0QAR2_9MICR|nr:hypothetical protein HERIO_1228 [Hepatospora eriocheir]
MTVELSTSPPPVVDTPINEDIIIHKVAFVGSINSGKTTLIKQILKLNRTGRLEYSGLSNSSQVNRKVALQMSEYSELPADDLDTDAVVFCVSHKKLREIVRDGTFEDKYIDDALYRLKKQRQIIILCATMTDRGPISDYLEGMNSTRREADIVAIKYRISTFLLVSKYRRTSINGLVNEIIRAAETDKESIVEEVCCPCLFPKGCF